MNYTFVAIICIIFIVIMLLYFNYKVYEEEIYVKSDIDGRTYLIRHGSHKSEQFLKDSANTLAEINIRVEKLISHLESVYSKDDTKNYFILKLKENYHPYMISEAAVDPRYTTFTVDKSDINICLRTRDKNEYIYNINLLRIQLL